MTRDDFLEKCIAFSVKVNKLREFLRKKKHEYNNSDQIQRSGTSIGANYSEACHAVSKADFTNKLAIAQKEAHETIYWLNVIYRSDYISENLYNELMGDVKELHKLLSSSIMTIKNNEK